MTILVEDGTGLIDANSYVDETTFETYCDDRGLTPASGDVEAALVRATAAIDANWNGRFPGYKVKGRQQALQWPRAVAYDTDQQAIDSESVPPEIIQATCEATLREL